jgi:hypothetical protein
MTSQLPDSPEKDLLITEAHFIKFDNLSFDKLFFDIKTYIAPTEANTTTMKSQKGPKCLFFIQPGGIRSHDRSLSRKQRRITRPRRQGEI